MLLRPNYYDEAPRLRYDRLGFLWVTRRFVFATKSYARIF